MFTGDSVRHDAPMLSTDKAYTQDDLNRFVARVEPVAREIGLDPGKRRFRLTPKLDGIAGMLRPDKRLVTRGDGLSGTDITHAFERGMVTPDGTLTIGPDELVLNEPFFREEIEPVFNMRHPRNFIAGFVGSDTVKPHHAHAVQTRAIVFLAYDTLPRWEGNAATLLAEWQALMLRLRSLVPYRTDGVVVESIEPAIRTHMGSTHHHHRWQVALKSKGETARTIVQTIRLQTGRTGRITPVLEILPVYLAGAEISNVTAHTAANLTERGLGIGAEIEIIRSGDVIPKLEQVTRPAEQPFAVDHCPSCGHGAETEGEYKVCPNAVGCPAQAESRLKHFFHTVGNADLFGPKTVAVLVENGYTELRGLFDLTAGDFGALGFGPGQSANLVRELDRCRFEAAADWRFLAALGLRHLGRGDARKLLAIHSLESVTSLVAEDIAAVDGFGPITSASIAEQLQEQRERIEAMIALGFNLERTQRAGEGAVSSGPLAGHAIVFTGKLESGSREALVAQARAWGATIQTAVNSKTTLLVCGAKAGAKRAKAEAINAKAGHEQVRILGEVEYRAILTLEERTSP